MDSKHSAGLPKAFTSDDLAWMVNVLDQVQSGISISDAQQPDFPLIYVNESFVKMTGYSSEEVLGKNCRFLQGNEKEQHARKIIQEALVSGKPAEVVLKNYTKTGKLFYNRLVLSPVFDVDNKLTHFIGIQNDITQQLLRESEIENQRHINEKLSKLASLGELSSSIVHEINSPMMILITQLDEMKEILKKMTNVDELFHLVKSCGSATDRIINITKSLRSYSHESSEYRVEKVDLGVLLKETLELCIPRIKGSSIALNYTFQPEHFFANVHKIQFSQVIINLFNNAVDAIESINVNNNGLISIEIENGAQFIHVKVYDSGPGVPVELRDKMFQSFFTTKGIDKGTGLGLSLSRKFCHRMEGQLTYHDEKGRHYFQVALQKA
jgi:PAS domain S-box-containing protein